MADLEQKRELAFTEQIANLDIEPLERLSLALSKIVSSFAPHYSVYSKTLEKSLHSYTKLEGALNSTDRVIQLLHLAKSINTETATHFDKIWKTHLGHATPDNLLEDASIFNVALVTTDIRAIQTALEGFLLLAQAKDIRISQKNGDSASFKPEHIDALRYEYERFKKKTAPLLNDDFFLRLAEWKWQDLSQAYHPRGSTHQAQLENFLQINEPPLQQVMDALREVASSRPSNRQIETEKRVAACEQKYPNFLKKYPAPRLFPQNILLRAAYAKRAESIFQDMEGALHALHKLRDGTKGLTAEQATLVINLPHALQAGMRLFSDIEDSMPESEGKEKFKAIFYAIPQRLLPILQAKDDVVISPFMNTILQLSGEKEGLLEGQ